MRNYDSWPVRRPLLLVAVALVATAAPAPAAADTIGEALKDGEVNFDLRYRFESVDDDGFDEDAEASTIRLRLGYTTGAWHGLFAFAEFEGIKALGAEDYSDTPPGTEFPVVADPEDTELNRGLLGWKGPRDTVIKAGRQRIKLDNERFIGNVGWRQNEQTYDALRIGTALTERTPLTLIHINNVNRIFGEHHPDPSRADLDVSAQIAHVAHAFAPGTLTGYVHLFEIEDDPEASHKNLGLRFTGSHAFSQKTKLLYTGEFADQSDYEEAPSTVDATYAFAEIGVACRKVTYKAGYEVLEGDGTYAFQTPFATLHAFNGWTDKFLTTPDDGLEDLYGLVTATVAGVKLLGVYHDFASNEGSTDYGTELGLLATKTFKKRYTVGVKYASYDADDFSTDTDKLWLWLQVKN